jgi:macrolide transport system ATP-binding/permease protein
MLGILIGVAAVVAMLALGSGAKMAIEAQLSSLGSNLLVVRPGSARVGGVVSQETNKIALSVDDTKFLKERVLGVKNIAPTVDGRIQVAFQNKNWNTQLVGTTPVYAQIRASRPTIGRFFTEDENSRRSMVALLGATVVKELFQGKNPIGETVRINKIAFQVIGVLPEKGGGGWRDQDDIVIIPLETALRRVLGKDRLDSIDIEMVDASFIEQAQTSIVDLLSARKKIPLAQKETAFRIMNMAEIQNAITKSSETMSLLLSSIAAISLLVGGIGIMNIMLVSVTERTREIGLRKAIGAKEKDIMMQFMAESIVVSSVGGLMGIILGYLITVVITLIAGWITSISILSILLAFFFSATVGLIFGIYPARHASRLHPIDALRHS